VHVMTYASVIGVSCHYPFTSRHVTPMPAKILAIQDIVTILVTLARTCLSSFNLGISWIGGSWGFSPLMPWNLHLHVESPWYLPVAVVLTKLSIQWFHLEKCSEWKLWALHGKVCILSNWSMTSDARRKTTMKNNRVIIACWCARSGIPLTGGQ
jgi:hypothetical protein